MFGGRLKTWMENHIGRPRKKAQQEKEKSRQVGGRALILESSESLAQSDTGISSGSQQVLSSSGTDNKEGYCTTTMESERSAASHRHTAISLPSPESAYSTGYSTDGASPGGTGPPEYYINIRTGKHYFPSPAPTPTSPQASAPFTHAHSTRQCLATSFLPEDSSAGLSRPPRAANDASVSRLPPCFASRPPGPSPALAAPAPEPSPRDKKQNTLSTSVPSHFEIFNFSKSPCKKSSPKSQLSSLKLFLKSPRQEKTKDKGKADPEGTPASETKKKISSPTKARRWFKQPFQKLGHRRSDSGEEGGAKGEAKRDVCPEKSLCYFPGKENAASPRQRNRIKTNPWLPTEPASSSLNFPGLPAALSPRPPRNRSCTNTPLQPRKTEEAPETLRSRMIRLNARYEESKDYLEKLEKAVSRHVGQKLPTEPSDHSEEDLTLNEMMGTYNESYVYEKETDILSDSDPTDCEDYGTDSEAENGGDERDSHDDELDFIDNGSVTESDDNFPPGNTGRCSYHDVCARKNSFLFGGDRRHSRKDSECRKSFRREQDSKGRKEKRKSARKSFRGDEDASRRRTDPKPKHRSDLNENVAGLNLSRVLVQRMMAKNGSRSADGTPVSARSQRLAKELRETHVGAHARKPDPGRPPRGELFLVDVEADNRYRELILEAENIFESLQNSPVVQSRRKTNLSEEKDKKPRRADAGTESLDVWREAETLCCPQHPPKDPELRKNPKNLGLELTGDTPKKPKRLDLPAEKRNSFKAKSSAHSPLDPLGPTFRNFSVFKPAPEREEKSFGSSSEDSESGKAFEARPQSPEWRRSAALGSPVVPIAFQSLDLGKPLTSYCPQSEPVKRKIYSCSKTYDRLVKQFENKPTIFEESSRGRTRNLSLGPRGTRSGSFRGPLGCHREHQGLPPKERRRESERLPSPAAPQRHPIDVDLYR